MWLIRVNVRVVCGLVVSFVESYIQQTFWICMNPFIWNSLRLIVNAIFLLSKDIPSLDNGIVLGPLCYINNGSLDRFDNWSFLPQLFIYPFLNALGRMWYNPLCLWPVTRRINGTVCALCAMSVPKIFVVTDRLTVSSRPNGNIKLLHQHLISATKHRQALLHCISWWITTKSSSNENIFCVTGLLWGQSTGGRWIALTKASDVELWYFLWSALEERVDKQSRCGWFETPPRSLWRHCNDQTLAFCVKYIL